MGDADGEGRVLLVGSPVEALGEWLERADRPMGSGGGKGADAQSINLIVKRRRAMAGLERRFPRMDSVLDI